jgi:hypothetical protein
VSRAESPLRGRMLFNVGARRSGTLWLQRILTSHPAICGLPTETYLFSYGISQVFDRLQHGAKGSPRVASVYAEREPVLDAARDLCDAIFLPHLEPGAELLAERTPWHANHLPLIAEIYPDAHFIHIIRDGRDVARSLVSQPWGPETIAAAAEEWRETIVAARSAGLPPETLREVRYEELVADPVGGVRDLTEWLGVRSSPELAAEVGGEAERGENLGPDNQISSGKWRAQWTPADLREFEQVGGELLAELGYAREQAEGRRRLLPRLPRGGPKPAGAPVPERPGLGPTGPQRLVERLLEGIRTRRADRVTDLLAEDARVRILGEGEVAEGRSGRGRQLLEEWLEGDEALEGRQLVGEVRPSFPFSTVWLTFERDGGYETRVILLSAGEEEINEITVAAPTGGE